MKSTQYLIIYMVFTAHHVLRVAPGSLLEALLEAKTPLGAVQDTL